MNGSKIDTIKLDTWNEVRYYIDNGFWKPTPSYFEHVVQHGNYYPKHAFSTGQIASKSWLLKELYSVIPDANILKQSKGITEKELYSVIPNVAILGSWIGTLVESLHKTFNIERIYGIDVDAESIEKSERLNRQYVQDGWKYKGVVADISVLYSDAMSFTTGGELINVKPDWLINTSCEHMDSQWFETAEEDQLIVMQTNDSKEYDGHINICETVGVMQDKYPLSKTLYVGELITPAYTRLMQIGYK